VKISRHWEDMCRIAVSIHSGEVSAHEVTRIISRDGNPTVLGQAIAHYGRIFKTVHILRLADDEPYRREGKAQANLTEGRHDLARRIFHGKKGEVTRAYYEGMDSCPRSGCCSIAWCCGTPSTWAGPWTSCACRAIRCWPPT
jgi:TnpA family transposase